MRRLQRRGEHYRGLLRAGEHAQHVEQDKRLLPCVAYHGVLTQALWDEVPLDAPHGLAMLQRAMVWYGMVSVWYSIWYGTDMLWYRTDMVWHDGDVTE